MSPPRPTLVLTPLTALLLTQAVSSCAPAAPAPRFTPPAPAIHEALHAPRPTPARCQAHPPAGAPVRRLSYGEYQQTVRDLFPFLPEVDFADLTVAHDLPINGFDNNVRALNPTALLVEQWTENAARLSERAVARGQLAPCDPPQADPAECGRAFIDSFGRRVFRRPLSDDERERYHAFFEAQRQAIDYDAAVELTTQAFLQAPAFLHRFDLLAAPGPLDDHQLASRLSYLLWQSMPDDELFAAADAGALADPAHLRAQAQRLLADERAARAFADFTSQWLELAHLSQQTPAPTLFPAWDDGLAASLLDESRRFSAGLFAGGEASVAALLTSNRAWLDARVAALYGAAPTDTTLPAEQRPGLLTRGAFLATHARPTNGSPPLRGVAVLRQLLCAPPPAPPADAANMPPVVDPGETLSNRQLFETRTAPAACQACHRQIDGIGYAFEAYDAIGQYRRSERGAPVDARGWLVGTEDVDGEFAGAPALLARLAQSQQVRRCVATQVYRRAHGRDETDADACALDTLAARAGQGEGDVRGLLLDLVGSDGFRQGSSP